MNSSLRLSILLLLCWPVDGQIHRRYKSSSAVASSRRHFKSSRPGARQYANAYQLPKFLKPTTYEIKLLSIDQLTPNQLKLTAEVTIGLQVVQPTTAISFHLDLTTCKINSARLQGILLNSQYNRDYLNNVVTYHLTNPLIFNNYTLTIAYDCLVNSFETDQVGLYFYRTGGDRYLVTNDEPFYTRKWLPCWDEPEYKAEFNFLINSKILLPGETALTNGVYLATTTDGYLRYGSTPRISSYLVAFTVGKFAAVSSRSNGGVSVSAWYPPGNSQAALMANYYASAATRQLDLMADYTGIQYDGAKLDVIFVEMADDGMENWGLITQNVDTTSKEQIEFTAYHEVVHQWFGNLVTVGQWADIWLHEGFANFFQYRLLKTTNPFYYSMNMKGERKRAINTEDGKQSLVDRIYANSDDWGLAYSKGNAILNMLEVVLSEVVLQQALKTFLQRHQYGTANTGQLLTILDETAKNYNVQGWAGSTLNVSEFLRNYLYQPGCPTVTIKSDYRTGSVTITQKSGGNWYVPIWFQTAWNRQSPMTTFWLTPDKSLTIGWSEGILLPAQQISWDPNQAGYYVTYVSK